MQEINAGDIVSQRLARNGLSEPFSGPLECIHALAGIQSQFQQFAEVSILNRCSGRLVTEDFAKQYAEYAVINVWGQRGTLHMYVPEDWNRITGYTQQETANELYRKARPLRKEKESRDWIGYGRRAIRYAYGVAGDIDIATFRPTPEKILAFRQEVERLEDAREAAERERVTEQKHEEKVQQQVPSLRMR